MSKRLKKIKVYFKKAAEDIQDNFVDEEISEAEQNLIKKLLRIPESSILSIMLNILKNNENLRNEIYNKIYKGDAELEELA